MEIVPAGQHPQAPNVWPFEGEQIRVAYWSSDDRFTEAIVARARTVFAAGYDPWFCQRCLGTTCRSCGAPILNPPGTTLYGNGRKPAIAAITRSARYLHTT